MWDLSQYRFNIRPLAKDEGAGFLISFPDFNDCISDGETPEEAIHNGMDALRETIAALEEFGFPIPEPNNNQQDEQYQVPLPQQLYQNSVTVPSEKARKEKSQGVGRFNDFRSAWQ